MHPVLLPRSRVTQVLGAAAGGLMLWSQPLLPHHFPWRRSCLNIFKQEGLLLKHRTSLTCWFGNHATLICQLLLKGPSLLLQIHVRGSGQQDWATTHLRHKFWLGYHVGQWRTHRNSTEQSGTQTTWEERAIAFTMSQSVLPSNYTEVNSPSLHRSPEIKAFVDLSKKFTSSVSGTYLYHVEPFGLFISCASQKVGPQLPLCITGLSTVLNKEKAARRCWLSQINPWT